MIRRTDVATRRSGFFSLSGHRIRCGGALESGSELRRCPRCAPGCPRATLIGLSSGSLVQLPSVTRSSHKVMAIAIVMYHEFLTSGMYPSVGGSERRASRFDDLHGARRASYGRTWHIPMA